MNPLGLSIIIPVLNEEQSISILLHEIDKAMQQNGIMYEAIVIDDFSTDKTVEMIRDECSHFPVRIFTKKGVRGKAQSLVEGFTYANYPIYAYIDADMQYHPKYLPKMYALIKNDEYDLVVANRMSLGTSLLRRSASRIFRFAFGSMLHGIHVDVQSGLKLFGRDVMEGFTTNATSWDFDLALLIYVKKQGYRIGSIEIPFPKREAGESKINFFDAAITLAASSVRLKFKSSARDNKKINRMDTTIK